VNFSKIRTIVFISSLISFAAYSAKKSVNARYTLQNLHYLYKHLEISPSFDSVLLDGPKHIVSNRFEKNGRYTKLSMLEYLKQLNWSQSVFIADAGGGNGNGTAFYVGGNLVLTNKHVAETDHVNKRCGYFAITTEIPQKEKLFCKQVHYCSPTYDFCLIEMKKFKNGESLSDRIAPFKLRSTLGKSELLNIYSIGNAVNYGIQGSKGLKMVRQDVGEKKDFIHYAPTFGGSSGSPLIDESGMAVGINYAGKVLFPNSYNILESDSLYNYAVPSEVIIQELKDYLSEDVYKKIGSSSVRFKTSRELQDLIIEMKRSFNSDIEFNDLLEFLREKGNLYKIVNLSLSRLEKELATVKEATEDKIANNKSDVNSYIADFLSAKKSNLIINFVKLFNDYFIKEPALALKDKKLYINVINECNRSYHYYWTDGCIFEKLFKPTFDHVFKGFDLKNDQKEQLWSELVALSKKSNNRYFSFSEGQVTSIMSRYARAEISNLDFFTNCLLAQSSSFYHVNSIDCKNVTATILEKNGYTYVSKNLATRVYHGFSGDQKFLKMVESFERQVTKRNFTCIGNSKKCLDRKYREIIKSWDYIHLVNPVLINEIIEQLIKYHRR